MLGGAEVATKMGAFLFKRTALPAPAMRKLPTKMNKSNTEVRERGQRKGSREESVAQKLPVGAETLADGQQAFIELRSEQRTYLMGQKRPVLVQLEKSSTSPSIRNSHSPRSAWLLSGVWSCSLL